MLKKVLLCTLLLLILVPAGGLAFLYLRKPAAAPPRDVRVAMTAERIARGKVLFENICDCGGCHSRRDFTRFGGPQVPEGIGEGTVLSDFLHGLPGTVVAPNITPDRETGIGTWTDGEKIRAIREGVDRNGRALFPMMPYEGFRKMSDDDVESVVAYLNSLPPVRHALPQTSLQFPVNLMIKGVPQPVGQVPAPDRTSPAKYGAYLVSLAGCADCHTPQERGQPVAAKAFAGGQVFASHAGTVVTANITPDLDTGIGKWEENFFLKKFYDYKDYVEHGPPQISDRRSFTLMPWLGFSQLPPEDLRAIFAYLRKVKPVRNLVETHPGA
ncbi:MAG TPA: c-type cytochrome [Bryobacteraceae bacterium]|jgi:mono/diheme cytochrome c family protein|nr:c-type cytochrome [Bryobacteraceae bacterium]